MRITRIAIIFLLGILLVSGLGCDLLGGGTDPAPNPVRPSAPTLSSPNNGAIVHGTSITFQWNASPGATAYWLRVSDSAYPNLNPDTSFRSINVGKVLQYTASGFPDDGTEYVWGVYAGDIRWSPALWSPKPGVLANARIFTNGVPYGASLTPEYMGSSNQTYFLLTAYSKEPVYLDISNPDGSLLDRVYVPPVVETPEITENLYLPPAPSGGTYRFHMYRDVTGELMWEGEQTFTGPKLEILELSLNPHWVQGIGWDLQYLTMTVKNVGDMPIILYGIPMRLEKDGLSTQEITLAQSGDVEAEYGWQASVIYGKKNIEILALRPGGTAPIVPWGSEEQYLFGQHFDPGEYVLHITLSDQLIILPVPELAFESPP